MPALNFNLARLCLICGDDHGTCDCAFECKTCSDDNRTCCCAHKCEFCGYDSRECSCKRHYCSTCKKPHEFCHCYDEYIEWDKADERRNGFHDDCEDHFDDGWHDDDWDDDDMWDEHNRDEDKEDELVMEELHLQMNGLTYSDMCELMKETHPDIFEANEHPYTAFICPVCDCFLGTGHGCFYCTGYNLRTADPDLIVSGYPDDDAYDEELTSRRRHMRRFETLKRDKQKRGHHRTQKQRRNKVFGIYYKLSSAPNVPKRTRGFHDTCHACNSNICSCDCRVLDMTDDFYDDYINEDDFYTPCILEVHCID